MKQMALKYFTDIDWSLLALMLFFISFLFLIYRVYFFERKELFDHYAEIPLNNEEVDHVNG